MSAVLPKPNEYPTVWGLLNKAAEIDNGKSGGDGGKPDMNGTPGASDLGSVDTTEQSSTPESGIDQPSNTDGASFIFNEADEDTCTQDEVMEVRVVMVVPEAIIALIEARRKQLAPLGGKTKMGGSHETYVAFVPQLREC